MARKARPWFNAERRCWMVYLGGKKRHLCAADRKTKNPPKEALDRLDELLLEARRNPAPEAKEQTVASVIERYIEVAFPSLADGTRTLRQPYLQSFAELHGFRPVSECRPDHMQEWINKHPKWTSDWTKRDAVLSVQIVFNWAKPKIIPANPFEGFTQRAGANRRDLTPEEFQTLLRTTGTQNHRRWKKATPAARFRCVLIFLHYTGCRPGEASKLQWEDIDFVRNVIVLKKHKTITMQRQPMPRIIPLHPVVVRLLKVLKARNEGEHVFLNHRRKPWRKDALCLRLRRARTAAGLPDDAKLYGVRHAFGTRGIVNGCDIKTLSVLMGHTDTKTTEIYAQISKQRDFLGAAMEQITRPLAASKPCRAAHRPKS
ncbi:MAG: site-specific integrase [Planctomycetes bacterium]|nr:site-specific integrase [Planctomycetota bacterium]